MVVQKLFSLKQQQALSCQKKFLLTYCHFIGRTFTVRVTESGPTLRNYHEYAKNEMTFAFFGSSSVVLDFEWRRNFFKNEDDF